LNSQRHYLSAIALCCLVWLMACSYAGATAGEKEPQGVSAADPIEFDSADGASLPVVSPVQADVLTLKNFPIGTGKNRILIVAVQAEEGGKENVADMVITGVKLGSRALVFLPGSEVQLSSIWRGTEYFLKVALYYLLDPPSGQNDITVSFAGPVTSANVGAISLFNAQQTPPVNLVTNQQENQKKIATSITTKNNGAWVVDIVGCGHKSKLEPGTKDHVQRFNAQENTGGKSSLIGGTLPVPTAGEVALQWAQSRRPINRLVHVAVEISPYR
jgi:hypothetical protein